MLREAALVSALVLAGCLNLSADPTSPAAVVAFPVETEPYDLGALQVPGPAGLPYTAPLRGTFYRPVGATGPLPVILVLHGNHGTCEGGSGIALLSDCEARGGTPVPSHAGYAHLAEPLAAAGYLVLSLDGNAVNERSALETDPHWFFASSTPPEPPLRPLWREGREVVAPTRGLSDQGIGARAALLLATLDALREAAPGGARADLSRVGLVGHSRGGEAAVAALVANAERPEAERHGVRAVVALAPSAYEPWVAREAATMFVVPYCDGDEWDLLGASLFDHSLYGEDPHPRFLVTLDGGNHAGYNSVWSERGDDAFWMASDPHCGRGRPTRLTPQEQRDHATELLVPFLRGRVGEEAQARAVEGGQGLAVACAAGCPFGLGLTSHPGAEERVPILTGREPDAAVRGVNQGFARAVCTPPRCPGSWATGAAPRLVLSWDGEAALALALPAVEASALSLRLGLPDGAAGNRDGQDQDLRIALRDANGREAEVAVSGFGARALAFPLGGPDQRRTVLEGVRIPLAAFAGLDAGRLVEVELRSATPRGTLFLADLMLER